MSPSSVLGEELEILGTHLVTTRIRATLLMDSDLINFFTFSVLILRSCLTDELRQRLASKPGKEWTFSVFKPRATEYDLQKMKRGV